MPTRYEWLLFDADGTLFDYDRAEAAALEKTFAHFGLPCAPQHLACYRQINQQLWQALERGEVTPAALRVRRFELLLETMRLPLAPDRMSTIYLEHLSAGAELMAGAYDTLRTLHGKYRLAILTNGLQAVQRTRLAHSAIRDYVAALIISEEVGWAKPAPAFFEAAFARLGHPEKSAALMIGDSLTSDIQGGINYGIDTCWYNSTAQPRPPNLPITYEIEHLNELPGLLG